MVENIFKWLYLFYIPKINLIDVFEILFIVLAIYNLEKKLRDTRAWTIIKGIIVLAVVYIVSLLFNWIAIQVIFKEILNLSLIAMIFLFEPEIKKFLEKLGHSGGSLKKLSFKSERVNCRYTNKTINELLDACNIMSKAKTGALIVIERDSLLNEYISTGININSDITSQLLINIFEKNTPLHDGALIIKDDKIISATCYLPLTNNSSINKGLGTRHRAGIGLSEVTDAIVIIISEETGNISTVINGKLRHNISLDKLNTILKENQTIRDSVVNKQKLNITKSKVSKMIASLVFGLALWVAIMNIHDPAITKSFVVPVSIINEDDLSAVGKTYEIVGSNYVKVDITAARSLIESFDSSNIIAVADLQKLSYTCSVPVDVTLSAKLDSKLYSINSNNATILLELDEITNLNIGLSIEPLGNPQQGYYLNKVSTNTQSITLTGANSIIKTIDKVVLSPSIYNLDEDLVTTCKPVIYDRNGSIISNSDVSLSAEEFIVNVNILKMKEIPITISVVNETSDSFSLLSTSLDIDKVLVAGKEEDLATLDSLDIEIDVSEETVSESYLKAINIVDYLSEDIVPTDDNSYINVTMKFDIYETRTIVIDTENIVVDNLRSGRICNFSEDTFVIDVKGSSSLLDTIDEDNIICTLNVKGLNRGVFNKQIQIEGVPDGLTVVSEVVADFTIE